MIDAWRRNWYWVGGIIFVILAFYMGFWGVRHLERIQVIMVFAWMAMLAHQVEEYGWPGGFPGYSNILLMKEKKDYDHYPFNPQLCFFDNVFTCYAFYVIPIFFPHLTWLAIAQACSGSLQVLAHVIVEPFRTKHLYNPGAATSLFLQLPLAIYTMWYVTSAGLASAGCIALGWVAAIVGMILVWGVPVALMRNRNSEHRFTDSQIFGNISSAEKDMRAIIGDEEGI